MPFCYNNVSMRVFLCDHCESPVFFENVQCVRCGHVLAYLPGVQYFGFDLNPAVFTAMTRYVWVFPAAVFVSV